MYVRDISPFCSALLCDPPHPSLTNITLSLIILQFTLFHRRHFHVVARCPCSCPYPCPCSCPCHSWIGHEIVRRGLIPIPLLPQEVPDGLSEDRRAEVVDGGDQVRVETPEILERAPPCTGLMTLVRRMVRGVVRGGWWGWKGWKGSDIGDIRYDHAEWLYLLPL